MAYYKGLRKHLQHVDYSSGIDDIDVDPIDHKMAADNVVAWYEREGYIAIINKRIDYDKSFVTKHKLRYTIHKYDVWVYDKDLCITKIVIEIDQKENDIVILPNGHTLQITESRHNTAAQKRRDQIAEDYIKDYFPNILFIRIQKVDCFYPLVLNKILKATIK